MYEIVSSHGIYMYIRAVSIRAVARTKPYQLTNLNVASCAKRQKFVSVSFTYISIEILQIYQNTYCFSPSITNLKDVDVGQKCKLVNDFSLLEGQNAASANTNSLHEKYMTNLILSAILLAHSLILMLPPISHYVSHHQFQLQADDRINTVVYSVYILYTVFGKYNNNVLQKYASCS